MDHSSSHLSRNRSTFICPIRIILSSLLQYLFCQRNAFLQMVNYVFPFLFRFSQFYCICRTRIVCLFIFFLVVCSRQCPTAQKIAATLHMTISNIAQGYSCLDSSLFGGNFFLFFFFDNVKGINVPVVLSRYFVLCLLLLMVLLFGLAHYTWFCLQFYRSMYVTQCHH